MTSNFSSILDRPTNEVERPKPLPAGTYLCVVVGLPRHDKSSKKQTPFVEFTLRPTAALNDVDEDALKEALLDKKTGELRPLGSMSIRATYYDTPDAGYRLTEFLSHLGFDVESGKYTARQMLDETPNKEVHATLRHRASDDGRAVYAELASTAPAE